MYGVRLRVEGGGFRFWDPECRVWKLECRAWKLESEGCLEFRVKIFLDSGCRTQGSGVHKVLGERCEV